ncbi:hypothetical protein B0J11DRAFT_537916 [Dendryphion nanum]|uniref:Uncharacterized protein n=1 Tax=Dendryphion nanum TaxID=256645 RepID=A0A9P9DDT9_9PLEO|nr:hypothetical protein B0J11DRAFT_537916 [Dendryphion nanum]
MADGKTGEKTLKGLRFACLTVALIFSILLITACIPNGPGSSIMYEVYGIEITGSASGHKFRIGSFAICVKTREGAIHCSPTGTMSARALLPAVYKLPGGVAEQSCLPGLEIAVAVKNKIFFGAPAVSFLMIVLTLGANLKFKGNWPATFW